MKAPYLGYQPNILVIRTDDSPIDCYSDQGMPTFASTWASQFITFDNGVCNVALCCPSRVAGLTGQMVHRHGVNQNTNGDLMDTENTFLAACRKAGYYTAAVGKFLNADNQNDSVFGQNDTLGCDERYVFNGDPDYFDYSRYEAATHGNASIVNYGSAAGDYSTDVEAANVLAIIGRAQSAGKPFCIYWAPKCAHQGSGGSPVPAPRHDGISINLNQTPTYALDPVDFNGPSWMLEEAASWDASMAQTIISNHKEALRAMRAFDEGLDDVLLDLQSRGILDETVVMLGTDNTHEYGGMRMDGKGTNRREASSMLFMVRQPNGTGGTRSQVVADFDIAPTVCALAGATMKVSPDGGNFWAVVSNASHAWREGIPLYSNRGGVRYLGWWDSDGYSSAQGLTGSTQEGEAWGWSDFYMTTNVGADESAIGKAQAIIASMVDVTTLEA